MQTRTGPYVTDVNLVDLGSTEGRGVDRMFFLFLLQFMQFAVLDFGLVHSGSRPFNYKHFVSWPNDQKEPKHAKNSKGQIGHIVHLLAYDIHDCTIFKIVVTYYLW